MKKFFIFLLLIIFTNVYSQFNTPSLDAYSRGMGNAIASVYSLQSSFSGNPSLIVYEDKYSFSGTFLPRIVPSSELSIFNIITSFGVPISSSLGTMGVFFNYLGSSIQNQAIYSELEGGLSFGLKKLGIPSLPIPLHFGFTIFGRFASIPNNISSDLASIEPLFNFDINLGLSYEVNDKVKLGFFFANLLALESVAQKEVGVSSISKPRVVRLGGSYKDDVGLISADLEYEVENDRFNAYAGGEISLGGLLKIDSSFANSIKLRGGVEVFNFLEELSALIETGNLNPFFNPSVGFGVEFFGARFDYAFFYPLYLGGFGHHVVSIYTKF